LSDAAPSHRSARDADAPCEAGSADEASVGLLDLHPDDADVRDQVLAGLAASPKTLPAKLFYDERGSKLFNRITELPEYYPTRTELGIMRNAIDEMVEAVGPRAVVIEYGSGDGRKSRLLLDHLIDPAAYIPVEISRTELIEATARLRRDYPGLEVRPVCADYTQKLDLPDARGERLRRVVYFPGSTIGNFDPDDARAFLERSAEVCGPGGGMLIGVDLVKDPDVLRAAYDDARGVTAEFNYNLLRRINRELAGDFDVDAFTHAPRWNGRRSRMESHLRSDRVQTAHVAGLPFTFDRGETVHTENSYKYTFDSFSALASSAGWRVEKLWTDRDAWFSVQWLTTG